jgi:tetratricopeptide (TPR) repeat protein
MNKYIEALDSDNPQTRRAAIVALGKSGDSRALPYLAKIHQQDPDPELRELALKAGRYLKRLTTQIPDSDKAKVTQETPPAADPRATSTSSVIRPLDPAGLPNRSQVIRPLENAPEPVQPVIPEKVKRQAQALIEQSIDARVAHHHVMAMNLLLRALAMDPELEKEDRVSRLAAQILLDQGFAAYSAMNYDRVLNLLEKALHLRPDMIEDARLLRLAGDTFETTPEEAQKMLRERLGISSSDSPSGSFTKLLEGGNG